MKLLVDGKEAPLKSVVFYDDLAQYFTIIEVVVEYFIYAQEVVLEHKRKLRCKVLRAIYENNAYKYVLVSEVTWKLLNSSCSAYTGLATVKKLLASIGIKQSVDVQTNESFWTLPSLKFKNVIQNLNKFAAVASGGAPRFYVDIDGNISCIDLKKSLKSKAVSCKGAVSSDISATDWILDTPGIVDATVFSATGTKTKTLKFKELGRGNIKVNDTTGYEFDRMTQRLSNEFYFNYYSSRKVVVDNPCSDSIALGATLLLNNKHTFVVYARALSYPLTDGAPEVTLTLCKSCLE